MSTDTTDTKALIPHQEEPVAQLSLRSAKPKTARQPNRDQGIGDLALEWLQEQALFQAWVSELADGSEPSDEVVRATTARFGILAIARELAIDASTVKSWMDNRRRYITAGHRRRIWFLLWLERIGRLEEWRALEQPVQRPVETPEAANTPKAINKPEPSLRCGVGPYAVQAVWGSLRVALLHPEDGAWAQGDRWAMVGALWVGEPHGYLDVGAMTMPTLSTALKQWRRAKREPAIIGKQMTRQPASLHLAQLPEAPDALQRKFQRIRQLRDDGVRPPEFLPDVWLGVSGEQDAQADQALAEHFPALFAIRDTMPRIQRFNLWGIRDGQSELLAESVTHAQLQKIASRHSDYDGVRCERADLRPPSPLDLALAAQANHD